MLQICIKDLRDAHKMCMLHTAQETCTCESHKNASRHTCCQAVPNPRRRACRERPHSGRVLACPLSRGTSLAGPLMILAWSSQPSVHQSLLQPQSQNLPRPTCSILETCLSTTAAPRFDLTERSQCLGCFPQFWRQFCRSPEPRLHFTEVLVGCTVIMQMLCMGAVVL